MPQLTGVASLRLSPNEVDTMMKQERERRRKARIVQVRQQSKTIAARKLQAVRSEKVKQLELLAEQIKSEWLAEKEAKLQELEELYAESLKCVGSAHTLAESFDPDLEKKAMVMLENNRRAEQRYRDALQQIADEKAEKEERTNRPITIRQMALKKEKLRAKQIASLPPPTQSEVQQILKNIRANHQLITVTDAYTYSHQHEPLPEECIVERADDSTDAQAAAEDENERLAAADLETGRAMNERLEKARLRGNHALKRERMRQDYDNMMDELSMLERADRRHRQQVLEHIPQSLFLPSHVVMERETDRQTKMERQVEDLFASTHGLDLKGEVQPSPAVSTPTHTETSGSSPPDSDMPGPPTTRVQHRPPLYNVTNVTPTSSESVSSGGDDSEKKRKVVLKKIMRRIKNQREDWLDHDNGEQPPSDEQEQITPNENEDVLILELDPVDQTSSDDRDSCSKGDTMSQHTLETLSSDIQLSQHKASVSEGETTTSSQFIERQMTDLLDYIQALENQKEKLLELQKEERELSQEEHLAEQCEGELINVQVESTTDSSQSGEDNPKPTLSVHEAHLQKIRDYQAKLLEKHTAERKRLDEQSKEMLERFQTNRQPGSNTTHPALPEARLSPQKITQPTRLSPLKEESLELTPVKRRIHSPVEPLPRVTNPPVDPLPRVTNPPVDPLPRVTNPPIDLLPRATDPVDPLLQVAGSSVRSRNMQRGFETAGSSYDREIVAVNSHPEVVSVEAVPPGPPYNLQSVTFGGPQFSGSLPVHPRLMPSEEPDLRPFTPVEVNAPKGYISVQDRQRLVNPGSTRNQDVLPLERVTDSRSVPVITSIDQRFTADQGRSNQLTQREDNSKHPTDFVSVEEREALMRAPFGSLITRVDSPQAADPSQDVSLESELVEHSRRLDHLQRLMNAAREDNFNQPLDYADFVKTIRSGESSHMSGRSSTLSQSQPVIPVEGGATEDLGQSQSTEKPEGGEYKYMSVNEREGLLRSISQRLLAHPKRSLAGQEPPGRVLEELQEEDPPVPTWADVLSHNRFGITTTDGSGPAPLQHADRVPVSSNSQSVTLGPASAVSSNIPHQTSQTPYGLDPLDYGVSPVHQQMLNRQIEFNRRQEELRKQLADIQAQKEKLLKPTTEEELMKTQADLRQTFIRLGIDLSDEELSTPPSLKRPPVTKKPGFNGLDPHELSAIPELEITTPSHSIDYTQPTSVTRLHAGERSMPGELNTSNNARVTWTPEPKGVSKQKTAATSPLANQEKTTPVALQRLSPSTSKFTTDDSIEDPERQESTSAHISSFTSSPVSIPSGDTLTRQMKKASTDWMSQPVAIPEEVAADLTLPSTEESLSAEKVESAFTEEMQSASDHIRAAFSEEIARAREISLHDSTSAFEQLEAEVAASETTTPNDELSQEPAATETEEHHTLVADDEDNDTAVLSGMAPPSPGKSRSGTDSDSTTYFALFGEPVQESHIEYSGSDLITPPLSPGRNIEHISVGDHTSESSPTDPMRVLITRPSSSTPLRPLVAVDDLSTVIDDSGAVSSQPREFTGISDEPELTFASTIPDDEEEYQRPLEECDVRPKTMSLAWVEEPAGSGPDGKTSRPVKSKTKVVNVNSAARKKLEKDMQDRTKRLYNQLEEVKERQLYKAREANKVSVQQRRKEYGKKQQDLTLKSKKK